MLYSNPEIPDCVEYPLEEVTERFFKTVSRGDEDVKFYTSTCAYMIALALYKEVDRLEIYGFEMAGGDEYVPQKEGAAWWLGVANGMGVEIHFSPKSQMLWGPLYGYQGRGSRNVVR